MKDEYRWNIKETIEKLEHNMRLWNSRNLTFEGKVLIVKTFGISQLIFILQVCKLREACSKEIETIIFCEGNRIKSSILKNKYAEVGLNGVSGMIPQI